jgi:Protein of unknown function (DUF2795)
VERGSDKHGPHLDEAMKREVEPIIRAGRARNVDDWNPETSADDQPEAGAAPGTTLVGGTPPGMTPEDVAARAELASYLGKSVYPAARDDLLVVLAERSAPDRLVQLVAGLPADERFTNVNDLAGALGLGVERKRF